MSCYPRCTWITLPHLAKQCLSLAQGMGGEAGASVIASFWLKPLSGKVKLLLRKVTIGRDSNSARGRIVKKVEGSLGLPFFCHGCLLRMHMIECQQTCSFFGYKIKYPLVVWSSLALGEVKGGISVLAFWIEEWVCKNRALSWTGGASVSERVMLGGWMSEDGRS